MVGKSNILVTGGAGFIGSHFVEVALRRGLSVTVLDNLSTGNLDYLSPYLSDSQFEFVKGDIRRRSEVADVVKQAGTVVHLAALVSVPKSVKDPKKNCFSEFYRYIKPA